MAPSVSPTICATPGLPLPAWVSAAQLTVSPLPSDHVSGAAAARYLVKLLVVPEASDRCATVMAVSGRSTPSFVAAIAGSFQVVIFRSKMPPRVLASSWRSSTPGRL
jgi:hypothetical protein